jgi:MFS family permease
MVFAMLWLVFFLQGMSLGFWVPSLTNILTSMGLGSWVMLVFAVPPLCALVSPLIGGALADQRISADRLFVWSSLLSGVLLAAAFWCLDAGWHPLWFVGLLGAHSLASGPQWGLIATVSLTHLSHGERQFPLVRVGATIGWVVGGLIASYLLNMDTSPSAGYGAALVKLLGGLAAFLLPNTPPLGAAASWKSRVGLDAFSLLKQRDICVFFLVTALFSIPLAAFYMYGPEFLKELGDPHPTGTMTIAQWLEILCMFVMGAVMTRFRIKTILLWALGLSVLRYLMSAAAGVSGWMPWHICGIALHGISYTFFFITAQVYLDRRVDPGLKGQAQGLLVLASGGIGPLVGALFCGWLQSTCVNANGAGWDWFWGILAAMVAGCFIIFALCYQGERKPSRSTSE